MGSSSSARPRSSVTKSLPDIVRSSSETPRVPSRQEFKEVQLGALGQPGVVVPSGGASRSSSTSAAAPSPADSGRNSAMAHPEGLQREKSFGFSSAQPTYTVRCFKYTKVKSLFVKHRVIVNVIKICKFLEFGKTH